MPENANRTIEKTEAGFLKRGLGSVRAALSYLKQNRKRLFWLWIAYQTVKGLLTLSLIWLPLLLLWLNR